MIRALLPVMISLCATPIAAQTDLSSCENIPYSPENCVRVFACIGDQGLYFQGQALGWDQGAVLGLTSTDHHCTGSWTSNGPLGTGLASLDCEGDLTANVIYYAQDNETGTVIVRGTDNHGRTIEVWTGTNLREFFTPDGALSATLPCAVDEFLLG